jgi:hypothetical protein
LRHGSTFFPHQTNQVPRFPWNHWADILRFSEANPEPLPLLHTLGIFATGEDNPDDFGMITPPSIPLQQCRKSKGLPLPLKIGPDTIPQSLRLSEPRLIRFFGNAYPQEFRFATTRLPGSFTDATNGAHEDHRGHIARRRPSGKAVVLPSVENFTLIMTDGGAGYMTTTHISCPSARYTRQLHTKRY